MIIRAAAASPGIESLTDLGGAGRATYIRRVGGPTRSHASGNEDSKGGWLPETTRSEYNNLPLVKHVADNASDTLIVWTETNGTDMALSFQEADGCAVIW